MLTAKWIAAQTPTQQFIYAKIAHKDKRTTGMDSNQQQRNKSNNNGAGKTTINKTISFLTYFLVSLGHEAQPRIDNNSQQQRWV